MQQRHEAIRGLDALRLALWQILQLEPALAPGLAGSADVGRGGAGRARHREAGWLLSEAVDRLPPELPSDADLAVSSEVDEVEASRLIALVELARGGDRDAFGMLFDHYHLSVYRFCYYRVGSAALAEDLTSETFFRALRSMSSFRWQGKDCGAWLMTIARNLTTDHFKAGRTRLELTTDDMGRHDAATEGPEKVVLAGLTNDALLGALHRLPTEQQECLILRFLQGRSIAETAAALGRTDGAVKQLQLRGVRNLAKLLPEDVR
jgi:RNA polymerase sigma-70 factor (ECF subfamily)